jgi:hypothetical protein
MGPQILLSRQVRQPGFKRVQSLISPLLFYRLAVAGNCRWVQVPELRSQVDMLHVF